MTGAGRPARAADGAFEIVEGYRPGSIGRIAALHADYYSRHWGLGLFFEAKVARDCADFCSRIDPVRDRLWLVAEPEAGAEGIAGSLAIDGGENPAGRSAHLRWFILGERARGRGFGEALMRRAADFCRQAGFDSVYLWTFAGLDAARHLYERHGFRLADAMNNEQWGRAMPEQRFVLQLK